MAQQAGPKKMVDIFDTRYSNHYFKSQMENSLKERGNRQTGTKRGAGTRD